MPEAESGGSSTLGLAVANKQRPVADIMSYEFDVLKRILLQGRESGVGVVLASQYLSHFRTRPQDYAESLLTWFVHKVPTITVKELEGIVLSREDAAVAERVKMLACHEGLYKTVDVAGEFMRGVLFTKF